MLETNLKRFTGSQQTKDNKQMADGPLKIIGKHKDEVICNYKTPWMRNCENVWLKLRYWGVEDKLKEIMQQQLRGRDTGSGGAIKGF